MTEHIEAQPLVDARLVLQQAAPFGRALGIELLEWGAGCAVTRIRSHPRIARTLDDPRPHPLALVGLLDDAFGTAFASVVSAEAGMSTLNLTIGFAPRDPIVGNMTTEVRAMIVGDHSAAGQAHARDTDGATLAIATALFTTGSFPGGVPVSKRAVGRYDVTSRAGPFDTLVGLVKEPGAFALEADNRAIIGWESGNALHGGAIGALLMAACLDRAEIEGELAAGKRLASLYIRFLRPAFGTKLNSASAVERRGRTTSFIEAACFHESDKSVATAQATFVRA